ncbi:NYN domain-containing protein [Aureimonas pseudogalii]|uniref:NYN domain-containing protein n=1 Tax=Aureimonas pseudogalii TaxID=1744844 RepID=UPI0016063D4E|nr:NYN domain-containing protein [Aureimonas pseudogalii]
MHYLGMSWGLARLDTHVYIDGFNLYYGLLKVNPHKWLNLERFCDQLLPKNNVIKIYYFTAKVDARANDPDQPTRQQAYLTALGTLPRVEIEYGTFMTNAVSQPLLALNATGRFIRSGGKPVLQYQPNGTATKAWVLKSEEKGSDVNLAAYLMRDAYQGNCQCAVIVSNDSDLLTPIRMVKADCGMVIGLAPPREKGSVELRALADFSVQPRPHHLTSSQFASPLVIDGNDLHKPASW